MLREGSSAVASFVEHLVYSISKMYSVLNLVFWFWFVTIYAKSIYKSHLFLKFQVLREGSIAIASFVEHAGYSISKMYSILILVFWFWFATSYPKSMYKSHLFSKFWVLRKGSSDIASFVEHPVYSISRMYSVLILAFFIWIWYYSPKVHV